MTGGLDQGCSGRGKPLLHTYNPVAASQDEGRSTGNKVSCKSGPLHFLLANNVGANIGEE